MAVRTLSSPGRRRGASSRKSFRVLVFHAGPGVKAHVAPITRNQRFKVTCYRQGTVPIRRPAEGVDAVLWELSPGRRPNWRRLNALARGMPVLSYSADSSEEVVARSVELQFGAHLTAPLDSVELAHHITVASPGDLATRLRTSEPTLRRYLQRIEVVRDMQRSVHASLDPSDVAHALAERAAAWLPAPTWAVVTRGLSGEPVLMAERGLAPAAEGAVRQLSGWVIAHAREHGTASLQDDRITQGAPDVAAIGWPMVCRGRTVGALVGVDRTASPAVPQVSAATRVVIEDLLEPAAIALDNACRLQRAEELSVTDDLTQAYNSRYLIQAIRREAKRQVRSRQPLSLLFIDLDGFKNVNDQNGHLYGSRALVEVAGILRECSRETDVVSRYGGDEFAVLLPDTGVDGAMAVARRVCERIRAHVFLEAAGINYRLTASTGVATLPDTVVTAEELIQASDDAMYQVKTDGKDGIRLATAVSREGISA